MQWNFKRHGRHEILTGECPLAFNVVLMSDFSRFLLFYLISVLCCILMFKGPTVILVLSCCGDPAMHV